MKPLTIVNVASPFVPASADAVGGAEQVVHRLDAAIVAAGHRSIVVARMDSHVAGTLVATPLGSLGDREENARVWSAHRAAVAWACTDDRIDLVHIHGVEFHHYLPPPGIPVLVTLHMPASWYRLSEIRSPRPGLWFNCVSASQRDGFAPSPGMLDPIANGIAVDAFASGPRRHDFALFLGRISPEKGVHVALEAAHLADVPLLIAGEVFAQPRARDYFDGEIAPRLDARRRFIGPVGLARKCRLLGAARCLLVPSLEAETSSLVAMEAMAAGTPVIAFAAGELRNLITDARTGFLVHSAEGMAAAIARVGEVDAATCRREALRRFSAAAMTASYLDLYRALIHNARGLQAAAAHA